MFKFGKESKTISQAQPDNDRETVVRQTVPASIPKCEKLVKNIFGRSSDLIIQVFETSQKEAMVVYVDGLINKDLLDRDMITPLKSDCFNGDIPLAIKSNNCVTDDISIFTQAVLQGNAALFYESSGKVFIVNLNHWDKRPVETPSVESAIRGPQEGFTESIRTNTALLRRKIRTPKFIIESITVGRQSNTPVGIAYVDGIVNQDVLQEIRARLSNIDTDKILDSGELEQYIDPNIFSPVSGIGTTQKPDYAAAKILDGRVALLCDGSPDVLTIPELFAENIVTGEDYYNRPISTIILRILRCVGLFITIALPGMAVAIITYSQEMMPTVFLSTLVSATQKMPLPAGAEIFLLIIMFEMLKEAGTRLPKTIGSAITIVGALIIGDSAVHAGIVSAPSVIVVALTAVTGFIVSSLPEFVLVYRLLLLLLGGTMGLIGVATGVVLMLTQLASTESFGVSILSFFSKNAFRDLIVRAPLKSIKYRPESITKNNVHRRK